MEASRKVVYASLASNVVIAIAKLIVAAITGSSAMLAEALHSIVDTANSFLLLLGISRSRRPAPEAHPLGRGLELYFWSFVVAVSMFSVAGGLSIWHGISHFVDPQPVTRELWSYFVLGIAVLFSAFSLAIALNEISRRKGDMSIFEFIRRSKDPLVYTVLLEDVGDVVGGGIAIAAIFLSIRLHDPRYDGAGSILIGLVILAVSGVLVNESRGLLVGEAAPRHDVARMKELLATDPSVDRVGELLTMQLGPADILLNADIGFKQHRSVEELEHTIDRLEARVRRDYPEVRHLFIEADSIGERKRRKRAS